MDTAAVATKTTNSQAGDVMGVLRRVTECLSSVNDCEGLRQVPHLAVAELGVDRAELWLWDEGSGVSLVHASGEPLATSSESAEELFEKIASDLQPIENEALTRPNRYRSAYLLSANGAPAAVLTLYSKRAADEASLERWRAFAEVCALRVPAVIAAQQSARQISQLSLLFEATKLLNSTLDLAELLDLILKIAREELSADRATVFLVDPKQKELWSIVAFGLDKQEIRIPWGRGIAGRVAETGETINVDDAYTLPYFEPTYDQKFNYRTRSLLGMPIRHHSGEVVGVIQLLNKTTGPRFTSDDEDFVAKLSGHMAMALENARLHRESLEKQRMEKELALARGIQLSLLPEAPPTVEGFDFAVVNEPCFECGGDYYDFVSIGQHSMLLVIADVEGKGVSSALVMSNLQATLHALVMHLHSLEDLAASLNEMIYADTKSGKYLSCFLGLVDTRRNRLHYINAGHVPPVLVHGTSGTHSLLQEGGTVVGLFPKADYTRGTVQLKSGDILVCCTDGILEACDERDEEYGTDKLAEAVNRHREKSAQEIIDTVLGEVNQWCHGMKADDKVLLVMKVNSDGTWSAAQSSLPEPKLS